MFLIAELFKSAKCPLAGQHTAPQSTAGSSKQVVSTVTPRVCSLQRTRDESFDSGWCTDTTGVMKRQSQTRRGQSHWSDYLSPEMVDTYCKTLQAFCKTLGALIFLIVLLLALFFGHGIVPSLLDLTVPKPQTTTDSVRLVLSSVANPTQLSHDLNVASDRRFSSFTRRNSQYRPHP